MEKKVSSSGVLQFELIELLAGKICMTCVLPLYLFKKQSKKCLIMLAKQALHALKVHFILAAAAVSVDRPYSLDDLKQPRPAGDCVLF